MDRDDSAWSPSERAVDQLRQWDFTVFRDLLSEDDCQRLIQIGRESTELVASEDRIEAGGVAEWNYLPDALETFQSLLPETLLGALSSACGRELFLRRRPFYKENLPGDHDDISYVWHKDQDLMQHTLIYFLEDVDESTPHTEMVKVPDWRRGRKDPRQSILGRVEKRLSEIANDERSRALGNAGDVAVIRTDSVLHRAVIPTTGNARKAIFVSMSHDIQSPPTGKELFSFDQQTWERWESALSGRQRNSLRFCRNVSGTDQSVEAASAG